MITILIPTLGKSPWLSEALDSCKLAMRDIECEVILVTPILDKEDKRNIENVIRKVDIEKCKLLEIEEKGIAEALNSGMKAASYELVARIDDDDLMHRDRLMTQLRFMNENPEIAVVGSFTEVIDLNGKCIFTQVFPISHENIKNRMIFGNALSHPSVMLRKSVVLGVGGYKNEYIPCEDYELWINLSSTAKLANIPLVLTKYRLHNSQSTKVNLRKIQLITKSLIYRQFDFVLNADLKKSSPEEIVNFVEKNPKMAVLPSEYKWVKPTRGEHLVSLGKIVLARSLKVHLRSNLWEIIRLVALAIYKSPFFTIKAITILIYSKHTSEVLNEFR